MAEAGSTGDFIAGRLAALAACRERRMLTDPLADFTADDKRVATQAAPRDRSLPSGGAAKLCGTTIRRAVVANSSSASHVSS